MKLDNILVALSDADAAISLEPRQEPDKWSSILNGHQSRFLHVELSRPIAILTPDKLQATTSTHVWKFKLADFGTGKSAPSCVLYLTDAPCSSIDRRSS